MDVLEKNSKLGTDFFLNNLEDDSILNQGKNVANKLTASCNKRDDFKSAKSHTSSICNIPTTHNSRSKNTSPNIIGDGNTCCSSSKLPMIPEIPELPKEITGQMKQPPKNLNLEQISSIIDYFSLQNHLKYNIPSYKSHTTSHTRKTDDKVHFYRLTNMIRDIIYKLSITLIPGPSRNSITRSLIYNVR